MASSAYLLVSYNEPIKADDCALVSPQLVMEIDGTPVTPESITTNDPRYPGKILIKLPDDKVPKVGELLTVSFTPSSSCNVVGSEGEFPLPRTKAASFAYNTTTNPDIITGTQSSQKPQIVSIKAPDASGGQFLRATFTSGRDISGDLLVGSAGQWTITVSADPSGTMPGGIVFTASPTKIGLNEIQFQSGSNQGIPTAIQYGSTIAVSYNGTGGGSIRDQFDLSMANIQAYQGTNYVLNPVFYKATVETENPYVVTAIFKKHDHYPPPDPFPHPHLHIGDPVDMSNNSAGTWPLVGNAAVEGNYKIWTESWAGSSNTFFDVSRVETVNTQWNDNGVLTDISAVQFTINSFPIPSNKNINLYWNSNSFLFGNQPKRMRDKYGNEVWNSEWDPSVATPPEGVTSTMDGSSVYIYNNIVPLEVQSGADFVLTDYQMIQGQPHWFPGSTANIFFKRGIESNVPIFDPSSITTASDFSFWNSTVNPQLSNSVIKPVDMAVFISGSDPSHVVIYNWYSESDFSKVINYGDVVKFFYTPGGVPHTEEAPWPTGVEDQYRNPLVGTIAGDPNSQGLPITNNIYDGSGQLTYAKVDGIGAFLRKIYLTYDYDICGNTVDATGFSVRITQPEGGEPLAITGATANGNTGIILQLDNNVLAGATGEVIFDNTTGNVRNKYGLKLKNEDFTITNLANGPGQEGLYTFTKHPRIETMMGKYDDINLFLDPSLNMEVVGHDKSGFSYKVGYYSKYPGGTLDPTLSTSGWVTVDESEVSINSAGTVVSLNTKFNTGIGVRGFSKRHTADACGNYIKIKYSKPGTGGLLGDSGYLQSFPEQSMVDISNNILVPTINLTTSTQQQPRDISNIIIFNELPNRVYLRIEQPDLSGGTSDITANRYWWDVSSVQLLNDPQDHNPFELEYSGNNILINSITTHNSDTDWPLNSSQNSIIPAVLPGTSARNSKWVVLTTSSIDFQPTVGGDPSMNTFDLSYSTGKFPTGVTTGIADQNGGLLAAFNTAAVHSNVKWGDIAFENANVPYIPDTSNNQVWFGASPGEAGFIFNEGTSASDFMYFPAVGAPFAPKNFSYHPQNVPLFDASMVLIFKDEAGNNLPLVTSGNDTAGKISYTKPSGRQGLRVGDTSGAEGQFNSTSYWVVDFSGVQVTNMYQGGPGAGTYAFDSGVWYSVYDAGTNKMAADLSWNDNIDGLNFNDISNNSNFLNQFILESEDNAVKVIYLSGKTVKPVWNNDQSHAADQEVSYTKNASTTYNLQNAGGDFANEVTDQLIPRRFDQPWFGFDLGGSSYEGYGSGVLITLAWANGVVAPAAGLGAAAFLAQFNAGTDPSNNFLGGVPYASSLNNGALLLLYLGDKGYVDNYYSGPLEVTYTPGGDGSCHLKDGNGDYAIQLLSALPSIATFGLTSSNWYVIRVQNALKVRVHLNWADQIDYLISSTSAAAFLNQFNIDSVGGFSGGVMSQFESFASNTQDLSGQWNAAPTFPNPYSGNLSLDYTKDASGGYNLKSSGSGHVSKYAAELTNQAISSDVSGTWVDLSAAYGGGLGGDVTRWYAGDAQGNYYVVMVVSWRDKVTTRLGFGSAVVNHADFLSQFTASPQAGSGAYPNSFIPGYYTNDDGHPNTAQRHDMGGEDDGNISFFFDVGDGFPTGYTGNLILKYRWGGDPDYMVISSTTANQCIEFELEAMPLGTA